MPFEEEEEEDDEDDDDEDDDVPVFVLSNDVMRASILNT